MFNSTLPSGMVGELEVPVALPLPAQQLPARLVAPQLAPVQAAPQVAPVQATPQVASVQVAPQPATVQAAARNQLVLARPAAPERHAPINVVGVGALLNGKFSSAIE